MTIGKTLYEIRINKSREKKLEFEGRRACQKFFRNQPMN